MEPLIKKSSFKSLLDICNSDIDDRLWILWSPLVYESVELQTTITVPKGFITDLASVPRIPFLYLHWGGRAHREAVIHDYLYRKDSIPQVSFARANAVFREAMEARGKAWLLRWTMWAGVWVGGLFTYHRKSVCWVPQGMTRAEIFTESVLQTPEVQTSQELENVAELKKRPDGE